MRSPLSTTLPARLRRAAAVSAALAAVIALIGLIGWISGVEALRSVVAGRPTMKPVTALCVMLGAAALALSVGERPRPLARAAARACAGLMVALAAGMLVEHLTGLDLRINRLLSGLTVASATTQFPGRPAPATACAIALLGTALLLIDVRWRGRSHPAELLAIAALIVCHVLLTGHAYRVDVLFRTLSLPATGTAVHTAVSIALLAVGVLLARSDRGLMAIVTSDSSGGLTARRLLVPALLGPSLLGLAVLAIVGGAGDLPLSHALLASSSATFAAALTMMTAASLHRVDTTRRRFEEESLRWRSVAHSAEEAIVAETLDGVVLCWNPAAERIFGRSAAEMLGSSMRVVVPEDRRAELEAARERVGRGEHVEPFETVRVDRDGARIDVAVSMSPVLDGERLIGVSTITRDIRSRKAAEVALARAHAAERDLRVRLEAMSTAAVAIAEAVARLPQTDLDAVLRTITAQAQILTHARYAALGLGTDPTRPFEHWAHVGMTDEQVAAIGRRPRPVGLLGEVMRTGRPLRVADVAAHPAAVGLPPGHVPMRSFLGVPIVHGGRSYGNLYLGDRQDGGEFSADDERVLALLAERAGTALETARLYREEQLAKAWLQDVIEGMPEAVVLADVTGKISCNEATRKLADCELGPDRLPRFDLRAPNGAPVAPADRPLTRALRGETVASHELLVRCGDSSSLPVLASASPLRDGHGQVAGAVCVLRDITPLKEIERMREEWTAVVAHDLRQPLTVISMSAQTIERAFSAVPNPVVWRALGRIGSAADRLARMVRDLLDTTRIETRQLRLSRESVDLAGLLAEVASRVQADDRTVRLAIAGPLPRVRADVGRVEQVLDNLLSNAFKYGAPGTEVVLAARVAGDAVLISARNRGPALTQEELARLFERFYRARSAGAVEGLGLGLYISRGLVEAHGGKIWAESGGEATTVSFTLPIDAGATSAA